MEMTMRRAARAEWAVMAAALPAVSRAMAAGQDAARPTIVLPPEVHSVRAAHRVAGSIMTEQPNFPAEMTRAYHNDSNWLYLARATSRTAMETTSSRIG
jgi:septum formation inhibitor-activating ATPase MinD